MVSRILTLNDVLFKREITKILLYVVVKELITLMCSAGIPPTMNGDVLQEIFVNPYSRTAL